MLADNQTPMQGVIPLAEFEAVYLVKDAHPAHPGRDRCHLVGGSRTNHFASAGGDYRNSVCVAVWVGGLAGAGDLISAPVITESTFRGRPDVPLEPLRGFLITLPGCLMQRGFKHRNSLSMRSGSGSGPLDQKITQKVILVSSSADASV